MVDVEILETLRGQLTEAIDSYNDQEDADDDDLISMITDLQVTAYEAGQRNSSVDGLVVPIDSEQITEVVRQLFVAGNASIRLVVGQ